MIEKTVINIGEVPLVDRGNGKQFACLTPLCDGFFIRLRYR